MAAGQTRGESDGARQVLERIERWRRTRDKRTAMPEELWEAAVSLAAAEGVYRTAQRLRVNYESLKARVERLAMERPAACRDLGEGDGFVEVAASQLVSALGPAPVVAVEMEDGRGGRMSVRHAGSVTLDVAALAAAFWARRS